jgi:membrane protease subunit (stomatin/prohibitin family)
MAVMQVIEWRDVTGREIVHRWPETGPGNVSLGAQLTVRESQAAVFFRDGQALDVFGPGRHTLTTMNIPLLQKLVNLPFGGTTPFQAEVYFVNLRTFTNMKWGTPTPIPFRDRELQMIRLRAYGLYTMRVANPQVFVNMVVGTEHRYEQADLESWLRDFIVARFTDTLGEVAGTLLDLPRLYDEIGIAARSRLGADFERYGVELVDFLVEAITPTEEVAKMLDERTSMEAVGDVDRFTKFATARAIREMPQAAGEGGAMATGAGIGAGIGIGAAMAGAVAGAMHPQPAQSQQPGAQAQTVACPHCQAANPAGAKFCNSCGKAMAGAFCECGAQLPPGAKFCNECGKAVRG